MKCTHPVFVLDRDKISPDLWLTFDRHFNGQSRVFVKSSDLRDKYSFFHLTLFKLGLVSSVWLVE